MKALHFVLFFPEGDIVLITFNAVNSVKLISSLKQFALGSGLCFQNYSTEGWRYAFGGAVWFGWSERVCVQGRGL